MNILQKICQLLTLHKFRKIRMWSVDITPDEYHYKCKICNYHFWSYKKPSRWQKTKEYKMKDLDKGGEVE